MNIKLTNGLLGLGALLIASQANAVAVQINPADLTVANGAPFSLMIEGVDFLEETASGGFQLTWDNTVMTLLSSDTDIFDGSAANGGLGGLNDNGWTFSSVDSSGAGIGVLDIAPGTFGFPTFPTFSGNFAIVTLDFLAIAPVAPTAENAFLDAVIKVNGDTLLWLDATNSNPLATQPDYLDTTITITPNAVVPVPAAVWLFVSGLLGLVGVARRRTA